MTRAPTPGERSQARWDVAGTRALLRLARASAANSGWTRADAAARIPEARRARVVYYGAPLCRPGRAPSGLPRRYVLCAARQAEYKGQDLLVFAWSLLAARGLRIPLVLVGKDHSKGGLARFARKLGVADLLFDLGPQSHTSLQAVIRRADFIVLPSRRESLGGVLLEAMAAGVPCVAARVGGVPELVRHGREGLLVEPKDPAPLARAVERLWTDGTLRRRLSRGAGRRSRLFRWDAACRSLIRMAGLRRGARAAVLVWERPDDPTAQAYLANAREGFAGGGTRPVVSAWEGLARLERAAPDSWVVFLLRYRGVGKLARFFSARGLRPAVYLC